MDLKKRSDQFDIRINISDDQHLTDLVTICKYLYESGFARYIHITSTEVGDNPSIGSYQQQHVHIALCLFNYTTKGSIIKKMIIKNTNYYIEPRNKQKPINGWISYHSKARTKLTPEVPFLFQAGSLPGESKSVQKDTQSHDPDSMDVKTKQKYLQWQRRKHLMYSLQWDQLDREFPGFIWTSQGQAMKREVLKQSNEGLSNLSVLENFIIWGDSGTGKSSSIALLYPDCYKKQKGSQYWDGYDKSNPNHDTVWIDEMSKETLATLTGKIDGGFEFLKELADRYPVTVDEKYTKGFKIRPKRVIITMNEHPTTLLPDRAIEVNKRALYRKFKILHISDWLNLNGLLLTSKGCVYDVDFINSCPLSSHSAGN